MKAAERSSADVNEVEDSVARTSYNTTCIMNGDGDGDTDSKLEKKDKGEKQLQQQQESLVLDGTVVRAADDGADGFESLICSKGPSSEFQHDLLAEQEGEESPVPPMASKRWSEILRSPSEPKSCRCLSPAFVPASSSDSSSSLKSSGSDNTVIKSSMHGLGLTVAVDRARNLSRCGKGCSKLLYDLSLLYESFAVSILKTVKQFLQKYSEEGNRNRYLTVIHERLNNVRSFALQMQGYALCIRSQISRTICDVAVMLSDTTPKVFKQYAETRASSVKARKVALSLRRQYVKSVERANIIVKKVKNLDESEHLSIPREKIEHLVRNESDEYERKNSFDQNKSFEYLSDSVVKKGWNAMRQFSTGSASSPNASVESVSACIREVKHSLAKYSAAVDEENAAVSRSQTVEVMSLETIQNLEEERLSFFVEQIKRMVTAEKGCLENMVLDTYSMDKDVEINNSNSARENQKDLALNENAKGIQSFQKLKLSYQDIPEDSIRDRMRNLNAIKTIQLRANVLPDLLAVFVDILQASETLSKSLRERLAYDGYFHGNDGAKPSENISSKPRVEYNSLAVLMRQSESKCTESVWNDVVIGSSLKLSETLETVFVKALQKIVNVSLPQLIKFTRKEAKTATGGEADRWQRLIDAVSSEFKHKERHLQAVANLNKATERLHAIAGAGKANDSIDFNNSNSKHFDTGSVTKSVRRSIGGLFQTVLGESDTLAKSVLTEEERYQMAQDALSERVHKEAHAEASFKAAQTAAKLAIGQYSNASNLLVTSIGKQDKVIGLSILEEFSSALKVYCEARYGMLENFTAMLASDSFHNNEWLFNLESKLKSRKSKISKLDDLKAWSTSGEGFLLEMRLERCAIVDDILVKENVLNENFDYINTINDEVVSAAEKMTDEKGTSFSDINSLSPWVSTDFLINDDFEAGSYHQEVSQEDIVTSTKPFSTPKLAMKSSSLKTDTLMFLEHFPDDEDGEAPTVIQSFSCAYWPKDDEGHISPLLHGRMFATTKRCYFVGWTGKKIMLDWKRVIKVEKEVTFYGLVPNAVLVTYDDGQEYLFGSFVYREDAFNLLTKLSIVARSVNALNGGLPMESSEPDTVLTKMKVVVDETISGVCVSDVYKRCWDGNNENDPSFYFLWLNSQDVNFDIKVGKWEIRESNGDQLIKEWCEETYSQKRVVTYNFKRTTHLYIGPPTASVTETQFCRLEGSKRCVIATTVVPSGIPYSDTFSVECRWVGESVGKSRIRIRVGVFVNFKKSSLLNSKIRTSTIEETKSTQENLLFSMKDSCDATSVVVEEDSTTEMAIESRGSFTKAVEFFQGKIKNVIEFFREILNKSWRHSILVISLVYFVLHVIVTLRTLLLENQDLKLAMNDVQKEIKTLNEHSNLILKMCSQSFEDGIDR